MYKCALVTGGAGFIGSHLALALKAQFSGIEVIALDNLRRRGSELNLPLLRSGGVTFVHGDVRIADDLARLPAMPDLIIECSAEASAQAGYGDSPGYVIDTNLTGCVNCLELARRHRADFLFLSTSRVYPYERLNALPFVEDTTRFRFPDGNAGIAEDFPLDGARSIYGATKLTSEILVQEYGDAYQMRYVINRCGLVSGARQMGKSDQGVLALWMAAHYFKRPLRYIGFGGQGKQVRDVLHVADLADLVRMQIENFSDYNGSVFNVGGGPEHSVSLRECTDLCQQITGTKIEIGHDGSTRKADLRVYLTDHRRISAVGGWKPRRTPADALQDIHRWLASEENRVRSLLVE
jgi:CDP-paratose 2-epimerase